MRDKDLFIKVIKSSVFFIVMIFAFLQLTYFYRGSLSHTRKNICGFYAEEKNSLDVVIIGTSSTFSSIMPMEIWKEHGITSYDMCTNVLLEDAMKFHVREMIKTQQPKLLIIDTAPFLFEHTSGMFADNEAYLRYNTDGFSVSRNRNDLIRELIKEGDRTEYYLDLFYYHQNTPSLDFFLNKKIDIMKGYNNLPIKVCYDEHAYMAGSDPVGLAGEHEIYFNELLEELEEFDGKVLFIEQPVFYTQELGDMSNRSEYMESRVKEYGYDYLDFSKVRDEIGLDHLFDYSLDYLHYNVYSAEKITDYLGRYIAAHYDLIDHREDPEYQYWHEQYQSWEDLKESQEEQTNSERLAYYMGADVHEYLRCLGSEYYSSCVYVPEDSQVWKDPGLIELFAANGSSIEHGINEDYFVVYDHSADVVVEGVGKETINFSSTFGYVEYNDQGNVPELFINGSEHDHLGRDNGEINIILARKATGEIVDNVYFTYDNGQDTWTAHRESAEDDE